MNSILTIIAIVLGPIIAVGVSVYVGQKIADRKAHKDQQFLVLTTIVSMQWNPSSSEAVKALNVIDLFFHDVSMVREKWHEYFDALGRRDLSSDEAVQIWKTKRLELIHAMASHLGYKETLQQLDFDRVYSPIGLELEHLSDELIEEFKLWMKEKKAELKSQAK